MKNLIIVIVLALILGVSGYFFLWPNLETAENPATTPTDETAVVNDTPDPAPTTTEPGDTAVDTVLTPTVVIGQSVEGRDIIAHRFGAGAADVLIVGGIHGAYAPNTNALAEQLIDYIDNNANFVPAGVTLHVVPNLNPDGLATGASPAGRFNANDVDLNRNFDCEWAPEGVWRSQTVSGGAAPFSEPEAAALHDYVNEVEPDAAVVYYAADGGVYASNCRNGVTAATLDLTNTYADASDYTANESFDFYQITGDAVNWMARENIPAISVLLSDYSDSEWERNRAGLAAIMDVFAQ